MASLAIPAAFGWPLITATLISAQVVYTGFRYAGGARSQFKVPYPDMTGRNLNENDWKAFNNAQRAHYNYVEGAASVIALNIISGLFFPHASAAAAGVYIIGRELYARGYTKNGPTGRSVGAGLLDTALVVMFGLSLVGAGGLIYRARQ
ncbi:hypothetical protein CAOG_01584 [Capsaspora owczarzaki ATCC 30864]|uniref:Microsomal glutathione S-transferase 3 n=1 Tax=Capsaspora owczarzaki (strain ATCC 30864) TaxID=595528 RepID=A0A0D2WJJ6_CAPO3|nr:hypothetical protein CAOG_01584 [Capsaspora owczarzaki ATCC 30864]KJE90245.1 hypothetical protein CAOG_001584 [Capsaspora owczarzaki ATCC 30864]|eukprot:XP_004364452.1 hypothetical protein CAOG_01584 [Capsaspora owczarzaki ATCC 30864]